MIYELKVKFREAEFQYLFAYHPSKKDVLDLLRKIWESLCTEAQDQCFVFLLFGAHLPEDTEWYYYRDVFGKAQVVKRGVIDNE